ncbi:GGDEF domain-containing protein [Paracoccus laeviglucosivorans]|uniref:diguanylate cyclase n=1 Tax=Paracoccus laeviglucosivorans TaxID=1197861 RepID=A0A521ERP1_9RHOB|nr:GGDEF domain-containing protein [Paracoccus laeviglucosivorans]SMO86608.1 diguanylate cyclase (GGDEF) domain-containing protein [Paracoccus laeviglucosivorans]
MAYSHRLLKKFGKFSVFKQTCLIVLAAVIGAETLTLIFYSIFFADRLLLDLLLTSVIVIIVGFPLAYFFIGQQMKLAAMATKLEYAARTDGLTGLTNRKTFFDDAAAVIAGGKHSADTLLFIDVDHFKSINDTYGHAVGDAVLRELASALRASIRERDLAARLGGEEFAVFLLDADREEALQVAERIRSGVRNVLRVVGIMDRAITVSVGVCVREPGQNLDEILLKADHNLYAAKNRGRDLVVVDGPSLSVDRTCRAGAA